MWQRIIRIVILTAGCAAIAGGTLVLQRTMSAQAPQAVDPKPAAENPKFEVASIKENKAGSNSVRIGMQPGGRFTAENVPLRQLITMAYQLQGFQLVGGDDWVRNTRFDIVAKAEGDIAPARPGTVGPMQLMVRSLIAERFKLVVHEETRELPIYALVMARPDKKLGDKLQPSTVDCESMVRNMSRGGPAPPPPAANGRPTCGMRVTGNQMLAGGFPLSQLVSALAPIVQRVVVDRTGLTGNYDLELTYTPEQALQGAGGAAAPALDPGGASIYTALQEQLGLKLDSDRGPVKVLVIDKAERPTED